MSTKAKRILALLANQKHRNYLVGEINRAAARTNLLRSAKIRISRL